MKFPIIASTMLLFALKLHAQAVTRPQFLEISKKIPYEKNPAKKADLLYLAAFYYFEKEGDIQSNMDSAAAFNFRMIKINKILHSRIISAKAMLLDAYITMETGEDDAAASMFATALAYAHKNGLKKEEAAVYKALALNMPEHQFIEKRKAFYSAISLYQAAGAYYEQAETYFALSLTFLNRKEADSALYCARRSLEIKKNIKRHDAHKEYHTISQALLIKGKYSDALTYGLEAEKIVENLELEGEWPTDIYNLLAVIYAGLKYDDKSLIYFKKALEIVKKTNDTFSFERLTINTASKLEMMKRHGEALVLLKELNYYPGKDCTVNIPTTFLNVYCGLKKYDKAEPYFEQLQNCMHGEVRYYVDRVNMYYAMINYLVQTGSAGKAYSFIGALKKEAKLHNEILLHSGIEIHQYKVDSATGRYLDAIGHLKMYKTISDSIFNLNSSKQLNELQLKYENDKKDKNIKLLTQQGKLQHVKIRNADILRYVFIGGVIVLAAFVALLYNRSRLKQRANKNLELKQQKINEQNQQLRKLLIEKEWLVKEIHHRVKNNLQVVISLLNTQSRYLKNRDALTAIQSSQNRMQAMSLIHQKLYQSDNLDSIDMSWYLHELVSYLKDSFNVDQNFIFKLDIESVKLEVAQAVPLGLLLNEAVSNALKYAFGDKDHAELSVSLKSIKANILRLIITDNGVGLPEDFVSQERESLGMDLMIGLTNQVEGTFELLNSNGLSVVVTFTKNSGGFIPTDRDPKIP